MLHLDGRPRTNHSNKRVVDVTVENEKIIYGTSMKFEDIFSTSSLTVQGCEVDWKLPLIYDEYDEDGYLIMEEKEDDVMGFQKVCTTKEFCPNFLGNEDSQTLMGLENNSDSMRPEDLELYAPKPLQEYCDPFFLGKETTTICTACYMHGEVPLAIVCNGRMLSVQIIDGKQLGELLDEDPTLMEKRLQIAKRLELYKAARDEIDSVSWARLIYEEYQNVPCT